MPRRLSYDPWLYLTVGLLVVGGILMVGSTSHYVAARFGQPPQHYLVRQLIHAVLGLALMLAIMRVPYGRLADRAVLGPALAVCFAALLVVMFMPAANGAHRWLQLGPLRLQPSEFAKPLAVIVAALVLARKEDRIASPREVGLPLLAVLAPMVLLIVVEPDLGTAIMLCVAVGVMLFVAGLPWRHVGWTSLAFVALAALGIAIQPYRLHRLREFLNADGDFNSLGWQLKQSQIALGSGGVAGVGFGQGRQKAYFLPEAHTDFVFSVIGEELGLIGVLVVLAAFLVLFWRGMRAAVRAPDRLGFYVAVGLTSLLVLQGLINMGVCIGLFPTKGLALPFVSYGGSSLMASLLAMGVLLNVSQHSN